MIGRRGSARSFRPHEPRNAEERRNCVAITESAAATASIRASTPHPPVVPVMRWKVERMGITMRADGMSGSLDLAHCTRMGLRHLPDQEEGSLDALGGEYVERRRGGCRAEAGRRRKLSTTSVVGGAGSVSGNMHHAETGYARSGRPPGCGCMPEPRPVFPGIQHRAPGPSRLARAKRQACRIHVGRMAVALPGSVSMG